MKRSWSLEELVEYATLLTDELNLLVNKNRSLSLYISGVAKFASHRRRRED